jgi:hypothetical protein
MMDAMHNNNNVSLTVRRIKESSFMIDERLYAEREKETPGQILKVDMGLKLSFAVDVDFVFIDVHVSYVSSDEPKKEVFTKIEVQNVFEVSDLKRFQASDTEILLPAEIITMLVGLSITHTRALMARNIAGTIMQENLIAVVDPYTTAKHFFPRMFEQDVLSTGVGGGG